MQNVEAEHSNAKKDQETACARAEEPVVVPGQERDPARQPRVGPRAVAGRMHAAEVGLEEHLREHGGQHQRQKSPQEVVGRRCRHPFSTGHGFRHNR